MREIILVKTQSRKIVANALLLAPKHGDVGQCLAVDRIRVEVLDALKPLSEK